MISTRLWCGSRGCGGGRHSRSDDGRQKYCRRSAAGWLRVGWPANGSSVRRAPANRRGAIVKGSEPVQIAGKCRCCGAAVSGRRCSVVTNVGTSKGCSSSCSSGGGGGCIDSHYCRLSFELHACSMGS